MHQNKNVPNPAQSETERFCKKDPMNKANKLHKQRGIGNGPFIGIIVVVLCSALFFTHRIFFSGNSQSDWLSVQAKALSTSLSGQVLGVFDQKPNLPEHIQLPILMYHHVGTIPAGSENDKLRAGLTVSPAEFEVQMAWLKAHEFNPITLGELYQYTEGTFELPSNPIILTFDDGYADVFENAVPILKKYGYRGSFAVITQFSGISYGSNQYASWDHIRRARAAGMEVVSHTQDHFDGTSHQFDNSFISRNFKNSQTDLKNNLGFEPLPVIVYPYGHYDENYLELTKKAGFKLGLTTQPGKVVSLKKLLEIPRLRVNGGQSIDNFAKMILE